jgi:very-short-patch-repair endonuclease
MRGPDRRKVRVERRLRRQATDAEMRLWLALRDRRLGGCKFVRQEAIGPFVVDFVCRERALVVEVDGSQHADNPHDRVRDAYLARAGYRIVRFWNTDVLRNTGGVLESILGHLQTGEGR